MRFPTMFSPIQIGGVTVPNRFVVPPMANNFSVPDGCLSQRSLAYYAARARGGFGLITIESAVVYEQAKGGPRKACLFADHTIDSFRRVAEACHRYGAKVSVQLQHAGPEGSSALTGHPLKAASPVPAACGREIPREMPRDEVYRLIECYGDAARRAQLAGLDMVEVHCAHGYLVSTFLSERTNHRTDEFGGCFENRLRLPRLIVENIRRKTGGIMPILCRINASDELDGGQSVQDAAAVAAYLEQECGVDAIHVSRAVHLRDEFMWAPGQFHGGFSAPLVEEIKRAVTVPVIAVGRFTEPQYAELLVRQGRADLIAFGRQSIADPELPNRARDGQLETLAPCIGCLLGCVPNMLSGRPITCAVNPLVGRELEELCWEPVKMDDPRLTAHPDWLKGFREFAWSDSSSLTLHQSARIERTEKGFQIWIYNRTDYDALLAMLENRGFSLPTADEWAYLCGGGCRTLFPWGDGLDYSMRLHWFEDMDEDENRPYDMEEPNFFGLSIAYDPYMREVVQADRLTTCGGDGGCNICGGLGPFLGFLPCSPHCKPEVQEDNELNGDYDFYRPIIRVKNYD